jgi:sigma-54-dependent transcriptional regulator
MSESLQALEELIQVNLSISRERDMHRLLETILRAARKMTAAEAGCIYILDRTKLFLHPEVVQGIEQPQVQPRVGSRLEPIELRPQGRPNMADISAYAALSGQLVNLEDAYRYTGFDFKALYERDRQTGFHSRSILVVPLSDHQDVSLGVMQLFNRRSSDAEAVEAFPASLEGLVKGFAAQAAVVANNALLLAENSFLIKQLDQANQVLEIENQALRKRASGTLQLGDLIGSAPAMQQLYGLLEKVSDSKATVLLQGATGTGKELVAACIHRNSPGQNGAFIAQNCAALPEDLLESELFGYRKGAFSGAHSHKQGLIEAAHKGTLFLDEIGDMPLKLQAKMLRVLQEREVRPLGAIQSLKVDIRVIAATHRDLPKLIAAGTFREDLYYRLNIFPVQLPTLSQRREDIPILVNHFIQQFAEQYEKRVRGIKPQVLDLLQEQPFPGNIRELRNLIERAVLLVDADGVIGIPHLPQSMTGGAGGGGVIPFPGDGGDNDNAGERSDEGLKTIMQRLEARVIDQRLQANAGNQTRTAAELGVSRRSLVEKLGRYQLREKINE